MIKAWRLLKHCRDYPQRHRNERVPSVKTLVCIYRIQTDRWIEVVIWHEAHTLYCSRAGDMSTERQNSNDRSLVSMDLDVSKDLSP